MTLKTGAVFLAEQLEAYGVTHVFMVPAILRRTLVEMEMRTRIKRLHVHSEKSAVYMADGFARAAGKPAICMAQVIGALNIAAGLREPFLANSPVVAFTGGRNPETKFRHVYQEIDDVPAFEPVTKFNATIDDVGVHRFYYGIYADSASNVTINNVCPAAFKTDRATQLILNRALKEGKSAEEVEENMVQSFPSKRFNTIDEIGDLVAFLASDLAKGITGTTIQIDGGISNSLL